MRQGSIVLWALVIVIIVAAGAYLIIYSNGSSNGLNTMATSTSSSTTGPVTFYCGSGNSIQATFATSSAALMLSDGMTLSLPQTISASGIRYESTSTGNDIVFASEGSSATLSNSASTTDMRYATCTAAHVTPANTFGYENYTDQSGTFSFIFPAVFLVSGTVMGYSQSWSQGATTTGMELAHIDVPQSYEPGTNFGNAWFTVGVSSNPSAIATCLMNTSGMPPATTTQVTINGVSFTKMTFTGAGAGQRYVTTSYRTVHADMCYAIEYTIHYGVLQNYPKGAVTQFNEQKIQSALDQVAQSFQF